MTGFELDWLSLREPADTAARAVLPVGLIDRLERPSLRVLDLGAGSGANVRYLAPRLERPQSWTLIDDDKELLQSALTPPEPIPNVTELTGSILDLSQEITKLRLSCFDLVTASAFFDLVSESWIEAFVSVFADAAVPFGLFVLNVDGLIDWSPNDPDDDHMTRLFNEHMEGDKGFGSALGPSAWQYMRDAFRSKSYQVEVLESPWALSTGSTDLQRTLLSGYVSAAREMAPDARDRIEAWSERRDDLIALGRSTLTVGHRDLLVVRGDIPLS